MKVDKGSTDVSIYFLIVEDVGGTNPGEPKTGILFSDIETGGSASYARQGAARVDLTLITLASASAAHADGGFILVDDTNMPGLVRCDYPDLAFATGVDVVTCQIVIAAAKNAIARPVQVDFNPVMRGTDDAALASEVTAARMATLTDWINGGRLDLLLDAIPTTAMRGTDGALTDKTGFSLSTAGILAVWHQALTAIVTAGSVGKLIKDEVTAVRMATLTDWINGGRLDLLLDAIPTTAMRGTDGANTTTPPTVGAIADQVYDEATAGHVAAGSFGKLLADVLADTGELQADDVPGLIAALNDISAANVNTEVSDVLKTDVITLPGQAAPPLTPTFEEALAWLYKVFRNRKRQNSTTWELMNDAETVVDAKATVSDDGTTAIKQEILAGP